MPKAGSRMSGNTGIPNVSKLTIVGDDNKVRHVNVNQLPAELQEVLKRAQQQGINIPPGMELQIVAKSGSLFGNDGAYIPRNNYMTVYIADKHPKVSAFVLAHELGHADFAFNFPKKAKALEKTPLGSKERQAQEDYADAIAGLLTGNYTGNVHDTNFVTLPKGY